MPQGRAYNPRSFNGLCKAYPRIPSRFNRLRNLRGRGYRVPLNLSVREPLVYPYAFTLHLARTGPNAVLF